MKRSLFASIYICCLLMLLYAETTYAETTYAESKLKIENYISTNGIGDSIGLYYYPKLVNTDSILLVNKDFLISPPSESHMFFIDEHPYQNWGHPCRFFFVNVKDGTLSTEVCLFPPENIEGWDVISIPKFPFCDLSASYLSPSYKQSQRVQHNNAAHCYALIISGGILPQLNHIRYWNDCSAMYSILKDKYGYLDENIYVIMSDGVDPGLDRYCYNGIYDSSPLDLDNDGIDDIEYPATKESLTTVCDELSLKLTEEDFLFVFTTDHGDTTVTGEPEMWLWGDFINAQEFAYEIDKIKAGSINFVMEQCFSGGFVPVLAKKNRTIATACSPVEISWVKDGLTYDEFVYHWMSAVYGYTPDGQYIVNVVDSNNDGMISMKEAFDYAKTFDTQQETPQYASIKEHYGEYVTLFGVDINQKTIIDHQSIFEDSLIHGYNVEINNSTINSGADIIIEASKILMIGPDTKILSGATFRTK